MGIIVDTDVWVLGEKSGVKLNLARWAHYGGAYLTSVIASELLVGVERANTAARRAARGAYVENLLSALPILEFSLPIARTHARMIAAIPKNRTATTHDAIIAATALYYGHVLLTRNTSDFEIYGGLSVEAFTVPLE